MLLGKKIFNNSSGSGNGFAQQIELISYYKLENNATDNYGNNDGTIGSNSQVLFESAKINNGARFIGTSASSRIEVNGNDFDFTDNINDKPFSIFFWLKMTSDKNMWFISKRRLVSSELMWQIIRYKSKIGLWLFDNTGANYIGVQTPSPFTTEWIHIAVTYDASAINTGLKIYINGQLAPLEYSNKATYNSMKYAGIGIPLWIGNTQWSTSSFRVEGIMDEIGIAGKELTAVEVQQIYNLTTSLV